VVEVGAGSADEAGHRGTRSEFFLLFWSRSKMIALALALNTRPRKTLEWRTPAEALDDLLASAS
jgi:IS30 family transposase